MNKQLSILWSLNYDLCKYLRHVYVSNNFEHVAVKAFPSNLPPVLDARVPAPPFEGVLARARGMVYRCSRRDSVSRIRELSPLHSCLSVGSILHSRPVAAGVPRASPLLPDGRALPLSR